MSAIDIRKIWADPELTAEYHDLLTEIRSLDAGIPVPPLNHVAALSEMRRILSELQVADI
jgi:hypothetical protein